MPICKKCNLTYEAGKNFCKVCGEPLVEPPAMIQCPNCSTEQEAGKKFCKECGYPLSAQTAKPPPPVQQPERETAAPHKPTATPKKKSPTRLWAFLGLMGVCVILAALGLLVAPRLLESGFGVFEAANLLRTSTPAAAVEKTEPTLPNPTQTPASTASPKPSRIPPTPTRTPVPTKSPQPNEVLLPYIDDHFSDPDKSEFEAYSNAKSNHYFKNGEYFIEVKDDYAIIFSTTQTSFSEFYVETMARCVTLAKGQRYGLVLNSQDASNFYMFAISNDGYYSFEKMEAGNWVKLIDATYSADIYTGVGRNVLSVTAIEGTFYLFINEKLLDIVEEATFTEGQIGLLAIAEAEDGFEVAFDYVYINPITE